MLAAGKISGIINVTAYGYHSLSVFLVINPRLQTGKGFSHPMSY